MSANVVSLRPADDADHVLECSKGQMDDVLILGYDGDGDVFIASSGGIARIDSIVFLLEKVKQMALNGDLSE